jgi:hypothetical protein
MVFVYLFRSTLHHQKLTKNKILSSPVNRIKNFWFEIIKNGTKYIVGGVYPNQNNDVLKENIDDVLSDLAKQQWPCFIAGGINIDLTKCATNAETAEYVDILVTNNVMPLLVMPTCITSKSATLIDHVYYYEGLYAGEHISVKSGNFLEDITDHLHSYVLVTSNRHNMYRKLPVVRPFSQNNVNNVIRKLQSVDWSLVYNQSDVNV